MRWRGQVTKAETLLSLVRSSVNTTSGAPQLQVKFASMASWTKSYHLTLSARPLSISGSMVFSLTESVGEPYGSFLSEGI
jgi:hypothetical protein